HVGAQWRPDVTQVADGQDLVAEFHEKRVGVQRPTPRALAHAELGVVHALRPHRIEWADERGVAGVDVIEAGEHVAARGLASVDTERRVRRDAWRYAQRRTD